MPVDAFIKFAIPEGSKMCSITGESKDKSFPGCFELKDFDFGVENKTSIGSATGGAGGGKAQFNEFTITKITDSASPYFFKNCAMGAHYDTVTLSIRKAGGEAGKAGAPYLRYTFKMVFTTKVAWSGPGDEAGPEEKLTFVYGALKVEYAKQKKDGSMENFMDTAWSQVLNTEDFDVEA